MRSAAAVLLIAAAALPAAAQTPDPIGAILARPQAATPPEPEEPDTAAEPAAVIPDPEIALPAAPQPYAVRRPQLTAPVFVDETGKSPDAPPTVRDLAYESRIRASFASVQAFQGPLDGGWTLSGADGTGLYGFELVDRGNGVLEGAWRDLSRPGAIGGSGFVDEIRREGGQLVLRFGEATATLGGGYGGAWTGDLQAGGQRRPVSLRKTAP